MCCWFAGSAIVVTVAAAVVFGRGITQAGRGKVSGAGGFLGCIGFDQISSSIHVVFFCNLPCHFFWYLWYLVSRMACVLIRCIFYLQCKKRIEFPVDDLRYLVDSFLLDQVQYPHRFLLSWWGKVYFYIAIAWQFNSFFAGVKLVAPPQNFIYEVQCHVHDFFRNLVSCAFVCKDALQSVCEFRFDSKYPLNIVLGAVIERSALRCFHGCVDVVQLLWQQREHASACRDICHAIFVYSSIRLQRVLCVRLCIALPAAPVCLRHLRPVYGYGSLRKLPAPGWCRSKYRSVLDMRFGLVVIFLHSIVL